MTSSTLSVLSSRGCEAKERKRKRSCWRRLKTIARLALSLSNAQSSAAKRLMEEGVGGWSSIRGQDTELLKFRTGTVAKAGVGALGATVQLWAAPRIAAPSMPGRRPGH